MNRCDVWIRDASTLRSRQILEALASPDPGGAALPAREWHAKLDLDGPGPTFISEEGAGGPGLIGRPADPDALALPGWTPRKLGEFISSSEELHVVRHGMQCPTLSVLAGFLRARVFAAVHLGQAFEVSFIESDGQVASALFSGSAGELDGLRCVFFRSGLDTAVTRAGLSAVHRQDLPVKVPLTSTRMARMLPRLQEWQDRYARGEKSIPTGAELSPLDLKHPGADDMDPRTRVVASARSPRHLYELIFPSRDEPHEPLDLLCAVDGELQPWPGSGSGFGAYPADWADWIIQHSVPGDAAPAAGPASALHPWEGDTVDARLHRMAHSIVSYDRHETAMMSFLHPREVQAWLKRALGVHGAQIAVHLLDEVSFSLASQDLLFYEKHAWDRVETPETVIRYFAWKFRPWSGTETWRNPSTGRHSYAPILQTRTEGTSLQSFTAEKCLKFSAVKDHLRPETEWAVRGSWFVLYLKGTDTCILLPHWGSFLTVETDNDWASAAITGLQYFEYAAGEARERTFREQWASWLDGSPLPPQAAAHGLSVLEELIERSGDDQDEE